MAPLIFPLQLLWNLECIQPLTRLTIPAYQSHWHNRDAHYLKGNPVHDLSLEMEGRCAHDGHMYANEQWLFVELIQTTCCGSIVNHLPGRVRA